MVLAAKLRMSELPAHAVLDASTGIRTTQLPPLAGMLAPDSWNWPFGPAVAVAEPPHVVVGVRLDEMLSRLLLSNDVNATLAKSTALPLVSVSSYHMGSSPRTSFT